MSTKKQAVFTNEIIYERNISDRVWPQFLMAQISDDVKEAWLATKCYYLFTQQWYPSHSKDIINRLRIIEVNMGKPTTQRQQQQAAILRKRNWVEIENIWCEISDHLENYGIFKRNFTPNNDALALPTR